MPEQDPNTQTGPESLSPSEPKSDKKKEQYMGFLVDGASPFNDRPSVHYRQPILGLMKEPFCFKPGEIGDLEDVEKASKRPIQPPVPFECPDDTEHKMTVKARTPFKLKDRDKVKGYKAKDIKFTADENSNFIQEGDQFAALEEGNYILTVTETYEEGRTCVHTYEIKVTAPPKSTDDDEDETEDPETEDPGEDGGYVAPPDTEGPGTSNNSSDPDEPTETDPTDLDENGNEPTETDPTDLDADGNPNPLFF